MPDTDIKIDNALLERIHRKKAILDDKRPLPASALKRLLREIRLSHTYHSNGIEGNTLTLQETRLILEEGITVGGRSLSEHLQAKGNAEAFDMVQDLSRGTSNLDLQNVLQIHEVLTRGWLLESGCFRTQNVRIAGASKSPPDFSKVPTMMDTLLRDLSKMKVHPIIAAVYLHHRFVEIHPFIDGNGRVARLLTNLLLMSKGYPPVVLRIDQRRKYYQCLKTADRGKMQPFVDFLAKAVDESLIIYLSIFGRKNELVPLSELAKASPYSQEYLSLRARQGVLDAVKVGRIWHSSRNALDDYLEKV